MKRTQQVSLHPYHDISLLESLVRQALVNGGLGAIESTVPLREIVEPGMTVLLKPNWVLHYNKSGKTMDCMITHPNFVLAVLKEVLKAGPSRIILADAPIQNADFDALMTKECADLLQFVSRQSNVEIRDLRNVISKNVDQQWEVRDNLRPREMSVLFDLKRDSLLEQITTPSGRFRNTNYNPDDMVRVQAPGIHQFLICKEPFEADVILNLPKLKTHAKAGITAALKNLVGINADKDYLPHHRVGGTGLGGDCYPGIDLRKRLAELLLDHANRRRGARSYKFLKTLSNRLLFLKSRPDELGLEAGWHGNDTVWRMVLDLNRLVIYGNIDGTLSEKPLRKIYTLTDAIIAGERNGPLAPEPVRLGAISFASNSAFADLCHSALMCFDWRHIPVIREAFSVQQYPLTLSKPEEISIYTSKKRFSLSDLTNKYGMHFEPPSGWKHHIELGASQKVRSC